MIIPKSCIKWLNLQRTGYKKPKKQFINNINKEFKLMLEYLPEKCKSILDIGCGIGGIDVLLHKAYGNPKILLMDKSEISKKLHYGYHETGASYNCFQATRELMDANKVKNYDIIDVSKGKLPIFENVDLIISLLSCGYHYPLDKYLDYIETVLSEDGTLIIDCRQKMDGITVLSQYFQDIKIISSYNKSDRVCARRNK